MSHQTEIEHFTDDVISFFEDSEQDELSQNLVFFCLSMFIKYIPPEQCALYLKDLIDSGVLEEDSSERDGVIEPIFRFPPRNTLLAD